MMNNLYVLLLTGLLFSATTVTSQGQARSSDGQAFKNSKASDPLLGFTANIPLMKLFGKKKVKLLPKQPEPAVLVEMVESDPTEPFKEEKETLELTEILIVALENPKSDTSPSKQTKLAALEPVGGIGQSFAKASNAKPLPTQLDLPALNAEECFVVVEKTFYDDGTETWTPLYGYCVESTPKVEGPGGGGGSASVGNTEKETTFEENANSCEKAYLYSHPWIGPILLSTRRQCEKLCDENGFRQGNINGDSPENAFKHALFQALNVCGIGEIDTREMAKRHEICDGNLANSQESYEMDTHNNAVGISLGYSLSAAHLCDSQQAIFDAVRQAYIDGVLRKIDGTWTP